MKRVFKIIGFSILGLVAGIIVLSFVVVQFYSDEIKKYIMDEVNKNLLTEVNIETIDFRVLRSFPFATIEMSNVMAKSVLPLNKNDFRAARICSGDTLFNARTILLKFNLFDVIYKEYNVKSITMRDGKINILIDKTGNANYEFWRKQSGTSQNAFNVSLKDVSIINTELLYVDRAKKLILHGLVNEIRLKGLLSSQKSELEISADILPKELIKDDLRFSLGKKVFLKTDLNISGSSYNLASGIVEILGQNFAVNGYINTGKNEFIDLTIQGKDLDLNNTLYMLPEAWTASFSKLKGKGSISFNLTIKGPISSARSPHIACDLAIDKGQIMMFLGEELIISDIKLGASFTNGMYNNNAGSVLTINPIEFSMFNKKIGGKFIVRDFDAPKMELEANGSLDLRTIQSLMKDKVFDIMEGLVDFNINLSGNLSTISHFNKEDYVTLRKEGKFIITDGKVSFNDKYYNVDKISGTLTVDSNIYTNNLSFIINDNDFLVRGSFDNVYEYFVLKSKPISLSGKVHSKKLVIDNFLPSDYLTADNSANSSPGSLPDDFYRMPDSVFLNASYTVESFRFNHFEAQQVSAEINYRPGLLVLNSLRFNGMEGSITGGGAIAQKHNGMYSVRTAVNLNNINIQTLFYGCENFAQDFIVDKNLKGKVTGSLMFSTDCRTDFDFIQPTIKAEGDLTIQQGGLVDFEPMKALSKFIDVKELADIKFATLTNHITIENRTVYIPEMYISSNAFEMSIFGQHTFDNNYEYHLSVLLSDILFNKAKKPENVGDYGYIVEDETRKSKIPLKITGVGEDCKVSFDTREAGKNLKEDVQKEGHELKEALNKEFGWFKKDSSTNSGASSEGGKTINSTSNKDMIFEWEDTTGTTNQNNTKNKINKDTQDKEEQPLKFKWEDE
jgi:hypothetical protein